MTRSIKAYTIPNQATIVPWISVRSFVLFFLTLPFQTLGLFVMCSAHALTSSTWIWRSFIVTMLLTIWQVWITLVSFRSTRVAVGLTLPTLIAVWWLPQEHALFVYIMVITWLTLVARTIELHEYADRFRAWNVWWRLLVQFGFSDVRLAIPIHVAMSKKVEEKTSNGEQHEQQQQQLHDPHAHPHSLQQRKGVVATSSSSSSSSSPSSSSPTQPDGVHTPPPILDLPTLRAYVKPYAIGSAQVSIAMLFAILLFTYVPVASTSDAWQALFSSIVPSSSPSSSSSLWTIIPLFLFASTRCTLALVIFTLMLYQIDYVYAFFYLNIGLQSSHAMLDLHPYRARSLRSFWSRHWNRSIQTLLHTHVFTRVYAKTRSMSGAMMATFVASGVLHTYPAIVAGFPIAACVSLMMFFIVQCVLVGVETGVWGGGGSTRASASASVPVSADLSVRHAISHRLFLVATFVLTAPLIVEPFLLFFQV